SFFDFTVTFTDAIGLNTASLDSQDLLVTGPNGFNQLAQFVSVDSTAHGSPRVATYRITAPGGTWNVADRGAYTITIRPDQVFDTSGNAVVTKQLATFTADIDLASVDMVGGGDFNGDGHEDILVRDYGSGENEMWLMNGATRLSTVSIVNVADPDWILSGAGDFDGDGRDDILWRHQVNG